MKPLVSIIIPCFNKSDYLSCCLASVKRQSYTKNEVIIASDQEIDKGIVGDSKVIMCGTGDYLSTSVTHSKGDYILFCSPYSYLSYTFVESALNAVDGKDYVLSKIMIKEEEGFKEYKWNRYSFYGKLFSRESIDLIMNAYDGDCTPAEFDISCYSVLTDHVFFDDYLYETEPSVLEKKPITRTEQDHIELWLTQLSDFPKDDRIGYVNKWISSGANELINPEIVDEQTYKNVSTVAKVMASDNDIVYNLASKHIKKWYSMVIKNKDKSAFNGIKSFFANIDISENMKTALIYALSITPRQYDYLLSMDMDDYLFFYDKLP